MPSPALHPPRLTSAVRRLCLLAGICAALAIALATVIAPSSSLAAPARGGSYAPSEILVRYAPAGPSLVRRASAHAADVDVATAPAAHTQLLRLRRGANVPAMLARLRRRHDVLWAVPNYVARTAGTFIPNDPGIGGVPTDWEQLQWNFVGEFGVNAPEAWSNVAADGAPGGRGVVVAVLDTGVAYANRGRFRRSPDFSRYEFVKGHDFIAHNPYPNDRNGHGTFVAGTIAESTNNHFGLTGLAYGVRLMPVRVLNSQGEGDASTIAEGVRFAVNHGAQVINLSLEFGSEVTASDIPELIEALRYAEPARGRRGRRRRQRGPHDDRLPRARARRDRRRRDDRTRLPGQLLKRRHRPHARRPRRRRRRRPSR